MTTLTLNKVSLNREKEKLETYLRFLPSLELKREQLVAERTAAARRVEQSGRELGQVIASIDGDLPMLANERIDLEGLASMGTVELGAEQLLGLHMPVLVALKVNVREYAFLAKPHWVDEVAQRLKSAIEMTVRLQIETRRLAILETAAKKVSQRINLFEQVLIPETRRNVKAIVLALSDNEKAAVVRAKLAKRNRLRATR